MTDIKMNFSANGNSTQNNEIEINFEKDINVPSKQIIIDGVDVSKCHHINAYDPEHPTCQSGMGCGGSRSTCDARCRYADEYRYKQQLDQLKTELEAYKMEAEEGKEINAELKAENENLNKVHYQLLTVIKSKNETIEKAVTEINQLKAENQTLKEQLAEMISQSALLPKFFGLSAEEIKQLATKCSQLEKAIEKIKEVAETCSFTDNSELLLSRIKQILQICDEVNDER